VSAVDLADYDPMDREIQQCPFDHYAALRSHGPVFHHEATGMYFVARHDVVNRVLRDTATFSSVGSNVKTAASSAVMEQVAAIMAEGWPRAETLLTVDPPRHTRYRKLVARTFSARRIARLEDTVRDIAIELIDAFPDDGLIDFHADFAVSLPVRVIHHTLNMSADTIDSIKVWSEAANIALGASPPDEARLDAARSQVEAQRYWYGEYQDRLGDPTDDILSELAHADFDDPDNPDGETRKLEFPEVYGIIKQLMVAGNETTTKFLNETMRMLIERPDVWAAVEADPAANIHGLVEEGLRLSSPNQGLFRYVTTDTELGGVPIPAGSTLWVMFAAANRDAAVFSDAETFDLSRPNLNEHLAFGKGHHFCIGAPLSRLEGRVAFEELAKRIELPTFAPDNTFEYEPSYILRGLAQLDLHVTKRSQPEES
jgi:cytochrome P450